MQFVASPSVLMVAPKLGYGQSAGLCCSWSVCSCHSVLSRVRTTRFSMPLSRRDSLAYLASLIALPWLNAAGRSIRAERFALQSLMDQLNIGTSEPDDPLQGTIVQYQSGRAAGLYTAEEVISLCVESVVSRCSQARRAGSGASAFGRCSVVG